MKSIFQLRKELNAKARELSELKLQRGKLATKLAAIDRQSAALTGRPSRRAGKRKGTIRAGKPLAEYIRRVLARAKKPKRAAEITAAVLKAGYPTKDKTFSKRVPKILGEDKRFKRVAHGIYKLRS